MGPRAVNPVLHPGDDFLLGVGKLLPQRGGPRPCLARGLGEVAEVDHGVAYGVWPGDLLDQAEPPSRFLDGERLGELPDVLQEGLAGLDPILGDPEPRELDFQLAELELLLIEGDAIVTTQFEVIEGVEEIAGDVIIIEEHVVHYLALVDDILGDIVHPSGVGVPRAHVPLQYW